MIFKFHQCFFQYFIIISPWKGVGPFIWINLNSFQPRMISAKFDWKNSSGSGEDDLNGTFVIISSWKRVEPLICKNLYPLHPGIPNVGWNRPSGSGEEDFFKPVNVILQFHYYLPLEKGVAFHLNKLESPFSKDDLCQDWLKLAQWFGEDFQNLPMYLSLFHNHLPLKGAGPSFEQTWIPITQGCFMPSLVKIGPVILWPRRRWKCEKFTRTTMMTEKFWSEKLTWAFG